MNIEDQGILSGLNKTGPLACAANSIAATVPAMQVPQGSAANMSPTSNPSKAPATIAEAKFKLEILE